jgi:hypothetical protein
MKKKKSGLSPRLRKFYSTRYLVVPNGRVGCLYRAWIEDVHLGKCLAICHNSRDAKVIAAALNRKEPSQ